MVFSIVFSENKFMMKNKDGCFDISATL